MDNEFLQLPLSKPPDPPAADEHLRCPLCDYNLSGLTDPRCPECGHTFEWDELVDPSRQNVRWLFEHRTGLRGYLGTQLRLLFPPLFFSRLRPGHRVVPERLFLFAFLGVALLVGFIPMLQVGCKAGEQTYRWLTIYYDRPRYDDWVQRLRGSFITEWTGDEIRQEFLPNPAEREFWSRALRAVDGPFENANLSHSNLKLSLVSLAAAPLGIATTLAVLRRTRRGSLISRPQLVRAMVYTVDVFPFAVVSSGIALGYFIVAVSTSPGPFADKWQLVFEMDEAPLKLLKITCVGVGMIMLFRFHAAARWYLRLPHPEWIALAAAVVAGLFWCVTLMSLTNWFWYW